MPSYCYRLYWNLLQLFIYFFCCNGIFVRAQLCQCICSTHKWKNQVIAPAFSGSKPNSHFMCYTTDFLVLCNLNGGTNLPHRRWIQSCATITRGCWCIVICTCTCCNNLWYHSAVWTQQGISSREFNAGNTCASWEWLDFEVIVTQIWKCQPSFTCKCFCLYLFWH